MTALLAGLCVFGGVALLGLVFVLGVCCCMAAAR